MGSARLPGKVMKKVGNVPLIGFLLNRLNNSKFVNDIILATTTNPEDDTLASYVESLGYKVYRGSEKDVLQRYVKAAEILQPDAILRITGDCVLIDVEIVDRLVQLYNRTNADYCWVDSSFAEGLDAEIISFPALKVAHLSASLASEREHITQFIHNNPEDFVRIPLCNHTDDSSYRIVVDEPQDLMVVRQIIEHFTEKNDGEYFSFEEIRSFLDSNPAIFKLNSSIIRNEGLNKSLKNDYKVKI